MSLIYLILILLVISNIFFISLLIKKGKFKQFEYLLRKKNNRTKKREGFYSS